MIDVTIQFKEDEVRQAYCMLTGKIATDEELRQLLATDLTTDLTTSERAMLIVTIITRIVELNKPKPQKHSFQQKNVLDIDELRNSRQPKTDL